MKIGITNSTGRLGNVLEYPQADLMDAHKYDVIIHNGAYTQVDQAEIDIIDVVVKNIFFTQRLRNSTDAKIIYISTDFVFDGTAGPYNEFAVPSPLSVYGWTKWMGERVLWDEDTIVRTTVLYGGHKDDFVSWVLNNLESGEGFSVSSRLIASPTNVYHLAAALTYLVENEIDVPIINIAGSTVLSRYAFASKIAQVFGYDQNQIGYTTKTEFGLAKRPERAGLKVNLAKGLGIPIYSVMDGLELAKSIWRHSK